jgi:hypothetical protein
MSVHSVSVNRAYMHAAVSRDGSTREGSRFGSLDTLALGISGALAARPGTCRGKHHKARTVAGPGATDHDHAMVSSPLRLS